MNERVGASGQLKHSGTEWLVRIEAALQAHFRQDKGPSRAGIDYKIGLKRGAEEHQIFVRAYLSPDLNAATRADSNYQAQTVIGYVFDRLSQGRVPAHGHYP
jgi:hypothetical protein